MTFILFFIFINIFYGLNCEIINLDSDYNDVMFGTKTDYNKVVSIIGQVPTGVKIPSGFIPNFVYLLSRHGARYPGESTYKRIVDLKNLLIETQNPLEKLLDPNFYIKNKRYNELTNNGYMDQFQLGKRLGKLFSKYIAKSLENNGTKLVDHLQFGSTCKKRAIDSKDAFKQGFFHHLLGYEVTSDSVCTDNKKLRFYDYCYQYKKHKIQLDSKVDAYHNTRLFKEMINRIESKINNLNLSSSNNHFKLSPDHVKTLYNICVFNVLIKNSSISSDPFCNLFNNEDLALWEHYHDYIEDIKIGHYYKSNSLMASPIFNYIYYLLLEAAENSKHNSFKMVNEFAHAETILPLYGLLNIIPAYINQLNDKNKNYMDIDFNVNKIDTMLQYPRLRRYGKIAPMNANILFVVLKNDTTNNAYIAMYINERLTPMDCCLKNITSQEPFITQNHLCPWQLFQKCYKSLSDENDLFDEICSNK